MATVDGVPIVLSPLLRWNEVAVFGRAVHLGQGAWIDLHWRLATDEVCRNIRKIFRDNHASPTEGEKQ